MYGGQPPPHPHQPHHAHQPFDAPGMPVDHHVPGAMDTSHFSGFSYPFEGIQDPGAMMGLPQQPGAGGQVAYTAESIPQPETLTSVQAPPDSLAAVSGPRASFDAGQGARKPSVAASDDGQHERRPSLLADTIDEPVADEFELSGCSRADGTDLGGKPKDANKGDAAPAWSELKTKAGKDRKRLPLACIACRRKKIRCSGEKPACKHCLRSRIPCVYKVTTRKAAPRTDYMAMLDKRLKRMEERIIKVIPKSDQDATSTITRAAVKPAIPGTLPGAKSASKKRGAEEAFGSGLEAWAKAPTRSGPGAEDGAASPTDAQDADENQLFQEGSDALPPRDIQEHLAEVYFDNVYGQAYSLLHKPSYMRKLKNNALPPVLILSVCAVAARFSASPKLSSSSRQFLRGEEWAAPARDICTKRYESPNITILTCLLILGLHEFGTCQGGRSWALGGQAIRMAFALQLHKDLEYDPMRRNNQAKLSFVDREIRRRIMWSCFIMDRFNSSGSERPMFIREDIINIPLPVKERNFELDMPAVTETLSGAVVSSSPSGEDAAGETRDNMGVAAYLIRAIALWGRIIAYASQGGQEMDSQPIWDPNSEFAKLSHEADEFPRSLPEPLQYSAENLALHQNHGTTSQLLLLHITIQQNILFLGRAALQPSKEKPKEVAVGAKSKADTAANQISQFLRDADESRYPISAPFAGYCAFLSTTMHIRGIVSSDPAIKAAAEANSTTNIRFLRKLMKFWGMFHWMEEDIRSQYRSVVDRARSGLASDDFSMPEPILQYGDWFNRYPHGVSDAEFMDPATQRKKEKGADGVLEQKPELQSVEEFFTTLSSPKASEPQPTPQPAASKRKTAPKKQNTAPGVAAQQKKQPDMVASSQAAVPEQQMGPPAQQPQQQQQRRASAPMGGQTSGPAAFHPLTVPHSQSASAAYHSMSPISPVGAGQFHPPPQGQPGFFQPNMLHMSMPQQPQTMMQPLDQQLSFGGYSMESGNIPSGQNLMNGVTGWSGAPDGQQMQGHGAGNGMAMGQQPHAQGPGQSTHNGMSAEGWFMPLEMQSSDVGVHPANPDAFNGVFNGNGMPAQNPLGGLRHGQ